jgi:hypothetical protein
MTTYVFDEIRWPSGRRTLKCRNCGRRFTRSRTFTQTVNPWNKNADGEIKTRHEIYAELKAEANAWQPDNLCTTCTTEARDV